MSTRARILVAVVVIFNVGVLVPLAGCQSPPTADPAVEEGTRAHLDTFWVETINGQRIPCVSWFWSSAGGLSCDWAYEESQQ
jgi:hypothetical protein